MTYLPVIMYFASAACSPYNRWQQLLVIFFFIIYHSLQCREFDWSNDYQKKSTPIRRSFVRKHAEKDFSFFICLYRVRLIRDNQEDMI